MGRAAIRSAQVLLLLGLLVVIIYAATEIRLVVVPLLLTTLIAAAASPAVDWFSGHRVPRTLAVWLTLLIGIAVLAAPAGGSAALCAGNGMISCRRPGRVLLSCASIWCGGRCRSTRTT